MNLRKKAKEKNAPHMDDVFTEGLSITPEFRAAWEKTRERRDTGFKLEMMRRENNLTQLELSKMMGKDQAFVARMESELETMPKSENIALFAKCCGYSTAYAFIKIDEDNNLAIRELQPVGQAGKDYAFICSIKNEKLGLTLDTNTDPIEHSSKIQFKPDSS